MIRLLIFFLSFYLNLQVVWAEGLPFNDHNERNLVHCDAEQGVRGVVSNTVQSCTGDNTSWQNFARTWAANTIGQWGSSAIGDLVNISPAAKTFFHGFVGGTSGGLMGGTGCVAAGIAGGIVGETLCHNMIQSGVSADEAAKIARMMSTIAGIPIGGNPSVAHATATNAVTNNCLAHLDEDAEDDGEEEPQDQAASHDEAGHPQPMPTQPQSIILREEPAEPPLSNVLADHHDAEVTALVNMDQPPVDAPFIKPPSPINYDTFLQQGLQRVGTAIYEALPEGAQTFLTTAQAIRATGDNYQPEGSLSMLGREGDAFTQIGRFVEATNTAIRYTASGVRRGLRVVGVPADVAQDMVSVAELAAVARGGVQLVRGAARPAATGATPAAGRPQGVGSGTSSAPQKPHGTTAPHADHEVSAMPATVSEAQAINQQPYHPRTMEAHLRSGLTDGETMTSSTLPRSSGPNVRLAGKEIHLDMPGGERITVPFDQRGFPIFDQYSKFETRLPDGMLKSSRQVHMRQATKDLHKSIERGEIPRTHFNEAQLEAIYDGRDRLPDLTWHHHQESGRMQLISRDLHLKVSHIGGMELWGR